MRTPNSTKWLPLPLVPSCDQARSFRPAVTLDTPQSSSITACWRRPRNVAPTPKRVSPSSAEISSRGFVSRSAIGRSSTVIFIRQAMSTPTAYGMTALSVASTPPIGRP